MAKTLFDKLWQSHLVASLEDGVDLIAIDRVMLHERTGGVALKSMSENGYQLRDPSRVFAVMDHIISFREGRGRDEARSPGGANFITETRAMARAAGIHLIDTDDREQGIVHVVAPEQGIALPGVSMICPDSHTCSLGALGALAWGVGSSEAEHAMATGTLRLRKPSQMRVEINGQRGGDLSAKDIALALIARHGSSGARRSAIEFCGEVVEEMSLEERLTLCNMAVEFSAFTAVIAPDEKVFSALKSTRFAPKLDWDAAQGQWQGLMSDECAPYDHRITLDVTGLGPHISWGTSPDQTMAIRGTIPVDAAPAALRYMGLKAGQCLTGEPIGGAFIGSCTNGRLSDLQAAARVLKGRHVAPGLRAVCVPGSKAVKRAAEAQGLDLVFRNAGFEWGEPGCAMCFFAGGETFAPGTRVVSSTNRNFQGRQGPGVRTHLASPVIVAASAIAGVIATPDQLAHREEVA